MKRGTRETRKYRFARRENRIPLEVVVQISGHTELPGIENTFTENVSFHGARIFTGRRWKRNDHLVLETPNGRFRSQARIVYCVPAPQSRYAVGVEITEPSEAWVVPSPPS